MDEIISYKMCRSKNAQCKTAGIFYFVAIDDWRLPIGAETYILARAQCPSE
jgi:hypothetical protein